MEPVEAAEQVEQVVVLEPVDRLEQVAAVEPVVYLLRLMVQQIMLPSLDHQQIL